MIVWGPLMDRHIRGTCSRGIIWIKLDLLGKVNGVYFIFIGRKKEKWVPRIGSEENIAFAKEWANNQLRLMQLAEELETQNKKS